MSDGNGGGRLPTAAVLASGLAGAVAVTLVNEGARRVAPALAPRLDELGVRGLARAWRTAGEEPPPRDALFWLSLAGDLVANSLYYSLAALGRPETALARGAALGLAAGVGAATLPAPLDLGRGPTQRSAATRVLTTAWYLLGGLAAAGAARLFRADSFSADGPPGEDRPAG